VCGFTTPVASVRQQLKKRRGGAADARLFCVVTTRPGQQGRFYRLPAEQDHKAVQKAMAELELRKKQHKGPLSLLPEEPTPQGGGSGAGRAFSQRHYGMERWADLFTPRQLLALTTFVGLVRMVAPKEVDNTAVQTLLALLPGKQGDLANSLCPWEPIAQCPRHLFGRQAIPIVWDFAEGVPTGESSGSWEIFANNSASSLESNGYDWSVGTAQQADAAQHPLLPHMADVLFTDPPYYDAVPYSDLSDFFHVWLKRSLPSYESTETLAPKEAECIVDEVKGKDTAFFERTMERALAEGRRIVAPRGIGVVVFAHKSTGGWEAQLQAMLNAGWTMSASWPVDTECGSRLRAMDSAALASSVHLVCRPRAGNQIGDWREVLAELPKRIHEWMPRLASEGIVGADAIFACLGPALEIFSRYDRVEKASGERIDLREYLEHVWAAVAREALSMVFAGADTSGFEPDARLTAMWLWTLGNAKGKEDLDNRVVVKIDEMHNRDEEAAEGDEVE
jgi:adenine-specific DNA methylase